MSINFALTSAQVEKAIENAKKNNPAYAEMLGFYGRLFMAQEDSKSRLKIEPIEIPNEILDLKRREAFPLVEIKDFTYDASESAALFVRICHFAREANPKLAGSASAILDAAEAELDPPILFEALLNGNEAVYENMAEALQVEKQILGLIVYNSLKPSLCMVADQLTAYLQPEAHEPKGYCPICGSGPILSLLAEEGARSLICSFCWHTWHVKRVYCPFCENRDNTDLQYLYNEEEKELRIDLCGKCNRYLKSVDTRQANRLIYPPLEQVTTLHLDIKAREEGFEPGIRLYLDG